MNVYDCVVAGIGGVGSAALDQAAQRGWRVLGVDPHPPGHDRGSSHGRTRITRIVYFEHPHYVPLAIESRKLWEELAQRSGRNLLNPTGLLQIGPTDGRVIRGLQASIAENGLAAETWSPDEVRRRYPHVRIRDDETGIFETGAGCLRVEECVRAHIAAAEHAGAELRIGERFENWSMRDDGRIEVHLANGRVVTDRLIIAGGAWSDQLLADLQLPLQVQRKVQVWFAPESPGAWRDPDAPVCFFETDSGCFYVIPWDEPCGIKIAEHTGGALVDDPSRVDRELHDSDVQPVRQFIDKRLVDFDPQLTKYSVCMYTMTPSEHFIVDRHPGCERVALAAGLSGHGFKFAPVLGRYLVELVDGQTRPEMRFLRLDQHIERTA